MMGKDDVFGCGTFAENDRENSNNSARDFNLSNLKCEFFTAGGTDEGVDCSNSRLAFKMEDFDQDFCICSRCRSLPNSLNLKSLPDNKVSAHGRNGEFSVMPQIKYAVRKRDGAQTIFGAEEIEVSLLQSFAIDDGSIASDDVPLLLNDSYESENEQSDHCHVIKKATSDVATAKRKLIISSCLCLFFMIAEIIGGYLSNSLAILTDAAHLLSDLTSFLISLFAIYVGQKLPTKRMSFGYYRAEVIGAVVSVLLIWVLTAILVYLAVDRVRFPDYEIDADVMLITSGVGVVINIIMGLVLHGPCGGKSHGHSHGSPSSVSHPEGSSGSPATQNINVRAAFVHVIGDLVQSVGVLIAAYIIRYKPEYKLADPICTFIFSLLVMFTTYSIMRDAIHVLMEGFPKNLNYGDIKDSLFNLNGVKSVHNLHIWSLTIDKNALSVHLAVDPEADSNSVLRDAQTLVRRTYNIYHAAIQIEKYDTSYMADCKACQGPIV